LTISRRRFLTLAAASPAAVTLRDGFPGAGGNIAMAMVVRARPNGDTLLLTRSQNGIRFSGIKAE
jgi:tripartite-type tricarboxylate transporter receptor subunit TctC